MHAVYMSHMFRIVTQNSSRYRFGEIELTEDTEREMRKCTPMYNIEVSYSD